MPDPFYLNPLVPPTNCIPSTYPDLVSGMAQYLQVIFNGAYSFFNYGAVTPAADQQDRPWIRTTSTGIPLGLYIFWNGRWTRSGTYPVGTVISYIGDAESSANFDATGKGIAGTEGEGWLFCNGQNGTPDLRNRFLAGGDTYSGSWSSNVGAPLNENVSVGGQSTVRLVTGQIPQFTEALPRVTGDGSVGGFRWGGGTTIADYTIKIGPNSDDQDRVGIIPPFVAVGWLVWNPFV